MAMAERDTFGTTFRVDGTWYVRGLGGGGVLLPAQTSEPILGQLTDGQAYRLVGGPIVDHRGIPTGFRITEAEEIGKAAPPT
jgi:hypothetical protein